MKNILFLVTLQLLHSLALVRSEDKNERSPEEELVELNRKKMVVLIPFQLLKLKKMVKNGITKETLKAL
ncbi:MAG: hypothetical protein PHW34_01720 [Hespellia sp.]|nr:hypothetical protein [Hespellia sp.]